MQKKTGRTRVNNFQTIKLSEYAYVLEIFSRTIEFNNCSSKSNYLTVEQKELEQQGQKIRRKSKQPDDRKFQVVKGEG